MNKALKAVFTLLSILILSTYVTYAQWSVVGTSGITGSVANHTTVAIDSDDDVYIAFKDNANSDKLSVKKWNGSTWSNVGVGISAGSVDYISMSIDISSDDIFIAYKDNSNSGKLSVKMYNGSSWVSLGNGITSSSVEYISLSVYSGIPFIAYKDNNQNGKATCAYYYNNNWYALGGVGFTSTSVSYTSLVITPDGYGYIGYRDNNNKPQVMKWTNNGWSSMGTVSSNGCSDVTIAADTNNLPYVCYVDWGSSNKLTVKNHSGSSWSNVGSAGITPGGVGSPKIVVDQNSNKPYIVYRDNNNNQKASVMEFGGSTWSNVGSAGFSSNTVDYTSLAIDDNNVLYVVFKDNAASQKATVMKYDPSTSNFSGVTWDGSKNTNWNDNDNWVGNSKPGSSDNVLIPGSLSNYPNITSGNMYCKDLVINSGASVTVNGGKLKVYGSITNNGSLNASSGKIELKGSSATSITSSSTIEIYDLKLQNSSGCTLNDTIVIVDKLKVSSGTLTTNNKLVLKSTSSRTGRIDKGNTSGGYISGQVTVQQYIPGGTRAFRFFSHPFNSAIKLSQLIDDIDITGQGGASNGFTTVQVNAPSAFWFDVTTADTSTTGNNPGWKAFTSANTTSWDKYEMARILCRGSKGQGLTQGNYTPNAVTIDMIGNINQGNQTITINKGNNSDFIICGNPFPSQIKMKDISTSNVSANFCVWDPNQGTWGGYTSHQFNSNYYLPAYSAFVTEITSGNAATFVIEEKDKKGNTPASLFKGDPIEVSDSNYIVELRIESGNVFWDRILIEFDSSETAKQNEKDMLKFYNPDLDFYTLMDDSTRISIDVRPYDYGKSIPLGIVAYEDRNLQIRVPHYMVPVGAKLYLHDKYLNKTELITKGYTYSFSIDTNIKASMGDERFEINMGKTTSVVNVNREVSNSLILSPNPADNILKVHYSSIDNQNTLTIKDITGKIVYKQTLNSNNGSATISVNNLNTGMYLVELEGNKTKAIKKLIIK